MYVVTFASLGVVSDVADSIWLRWNFDPVLWLGIALFAGAYFYALGPLRQRYGLAERVDSAQVGYFLLGTVIFAAALVSPLDTLGDEYLFSAHMIQHMLISVVVPPLWLLGTPEWMLAPLFRSPAVVRVARIVTHPVVVFGLFNAMLWVWHAPALYGAALGSEGLHVLEHLIFTATGVLFWWPVLSPVRALPRISLGFGVLYLFLGCQPMVGLGALLTFAAQPLYHPYVVAPHIWGSTPLGDQQLGGLIMWLPTNIPYLLGLSVLFFRWVSEHDRAERAAAGEFDVFDDPGGARVEVEASGAGESSESTNAL